MVKDKRIVLLAVTLAIIALFAGCRMSNFMSLMEDESIRADAEDIMDAIEANDSEYIYSTYFNSDFMTIEKDEFDEGVKKIFDLYKGQRVSMELYGVNTYSYKGIEEDSKASTIKVVTYLIQTTESTYTLTLTYQKDSIDEFVLVGENVSEFLNYVVNSKLSDYSIKNWILLVLNLVSYGIMITALILCIKTKINKKALWIILILLQVGITTTDFPNTYRVNYSFLQLLGFSKYLVYAHGGTVTSAFIHIFAIVFLFARKPLNKNYLAQQELMRVRAENEQKINQQKASYNIQPTVGENQEIKEQIKPLENKEDK